MGWWGPVSWWGNGAVRWRLLTVIGVVEMARKSDVNLWLITTAAATAHENKSEQKRNKYASEGSKEAEPGETDDCIRNSGDQLKGAGWGSGFRGLGELSKRVAGVHQETICSFEVICAGGMLIAAVPIVPGALREVRLTLTQLGGERVSVVQVPMSCYLRVTVCNCGSLELVLHVGVGRVALNQSLGG